MGLDLGGGSLEAGIGTIDEVLDVASVALGTARLRGELGTGELLTPADRVAITERDPGPGRADTGHAGANPRAAEPGDRQRGDGACPGPPGHGSAPAAPGVGLGVVAAGQPSRDPRRSALRAGRPSGHARPRRTAGPARDPDPACATPAHRCRGAVDPGRAPGAPTTGGQRVGATGGSGARGTLARREALPRRRVECRRCLSQAPAREPTIS